MLLLCRINNMASVLSEALYGAGTVYPSGAPEFISGFKWGVCCSILSFLCSVM